MRWFRREATGRHALGAAVTAIPSGPPPVAVAVPVAAPAVPVVPVQPLPDAAPPRTDVTSVVGPAPETEVANGLTRVDAAVPPAPVAAVRELPPAESGLVPVQQVPVHVPTAPVQLVVPAQAGPADVPSVEDLLDLAPLVQAPVPPLVQPEAPRTAPEVPERLGPRVELGFADGTYRMLDPDSETARVLADLVGELTSTPPRQPPAQTTGPGSSGPS